MRFLRITTSFQIKVLSVAAVAIVAWLLVTTFMVGLQIQTVRDRIALGAQKQAISESAGRVQAYRSSVDGLADRLEQRQKSLDQMVGRYFGEAKGAPAANGPPLSNAIPEAAPLAAIEHRQFAFAERLTMAAAMRAQDAEKAIRRFGLNPQALARSRPVGMGGPFIPLNGSGFTAKDTSLTRLARSLQRLDALERTLLAIPSTAPTTPMTLSSSFGHRSDPFNGGAALHAGMDVTGRHGQSITAAAAGRVIAAGQQPGYGNIVIIDHGHGLETRYGHLSGFDVKRGDVVKRGQKIARMGSTGRSTGTHLHFEVRTHGRAMNPRPFLEADANVLEVQTSAGRRIAPSQKRG